MNAQNEKAARLRALHVPGDPLVLVNAWDAVSARIVEELGFPAIASSSGAVAWAHGFADGEHMQREAMLRGVACIASAVQVPVTADLERGYGPRVEDACATARGAIEAGAAGLNFEDCDAETLFDAELHAERIAAMLAAGEERGVQLVINARTDVYLAEIGDNDAWRFAETVRRANRYLQAGAACAFVPGVTDEGLIEKLVAAIHGPVSVLAGAASPPVARLAALGVARVSVGTAAMGYVLAQLRGFASDIKERGDFGAIAQRLTHAEVNALFL
ncbi:MAG: isocitrate lyase/phosphoenolpyruvate mutase family protein [Candidatus Baltobacteraceae bacterium]